MMAQSSQPITSNRGRPLLKAETTVARKCRPIASSRIISGIAKRKTAIKYGMR